MVKWFWHTPSPKPLDRKAVSPRLAEVLFVAHRLTREIHAMNSEATEILQHWNQRLESALKELDASLIRGDTQPNKEKY